MSKQPYEPTCSKCGTVHYNFQPCGSAEAVLVERKFNPSAPYHVEHPDKRGLRVWGNRFDTIEMQGTNILRKGGRIRRRGGVTVNPDWPKEAA